jgi:hypothetical protein
MNVYLNNIWKFLGLFALQILIISHLDLSYYINPYVHLLFILTLPVNIPIAYFLLIAFVSGLTLDMFLDTTGLHAFASVFLAFVKPPLLNLLTPKGSYEIMQQPSINSSSITWFVNYLFIHSLIYLLIYFLLEVFSFKDFHVTFFKTLVSVGFSVLLMTIIAYLFSPNKKRRGA